jgi:probable phosphoglycerate mutase
VGRILGAELADAAAPHFVASPLGRARASMEIIRQILGLPVADYATDERLREVDVGAWTGLGDAEVPRDSAHWKARQADKWNIPCPGGESYAMVAERARDWFLSLTGETIAVSHGGFGRILRALYLDLPWQDISTLEEPHDCVFRLSGGWVEKLACPPGPVFDAKPAAP